MEVERGAGCFIEPAQSAHLILYLVSEYTYVSHIIVVATREAGTIYA